MWNFILNHFRKKRALWDRQYSQGQWEILKSPLEEERFKMLSDLIKPHIKKGNLLELGCGEGILLPLIQNEYSSFIGLDISKIAIERAQHLADEKTRFVCADMEKFKVSHRFNVIIFNESIYYAENPLGLLKRYQRFLEPDGVLVTSIFDNGTAGQLRDEMFRNFEILVSQKVVNKRGTWHCDVFR